MTRKPNGAQGAPQYMMPPSLPPAPGDSIFGTPQAIDLEPSMRPAPRPPIEHQTEVTPTAIPSTVMYKGGGIFADQTPGDVEPPSDDDEDDDYSPVRPRARGYDFGPNMAGPAMAPMHPTMGSGMPPMMHPPMAAPGMPDVGPPPTHGGVFGQAENTGTLGLSLLAVAAGSLAGGYYGGLYGALAGGLFGGAAVNGYRAFTEFTKGAPDGDKEAAVSGTYAVGATIIGAVIWAKLVEPRPGTWLANIGEKDDGDDSDADAKANADRCSIRTVGP